MTNWEAGLYNPGADAWQFLDGNFEVVVPGTIAEPNAHWLRIARDTMNAIDLHHVAARQYLDAFVDRSRFANGNEWEAEFVEFGKATDIPNIRFTIYYRVAGDEYGLWSVSFHPTGLPVPNDLYPVRFARQQQ
jgi:hypothetical protein